MNSGAWAFLCLFGWLPVRMRTRYRIHLRAYLFNNPYRSPFGSAPCLIYGVEVEVRSIRNVCEVGSASSAFSTASILCAAPSR